MYDYFLPIFHVACHGADVVSEQFNFRNDNLSNAMPWTSKVYHINSSSRDPNVVFSVYF